jgi:hypothetical protein
MTPWRILEYVTEGAIRPFQRWYDTLDTETQAAFDHTVLQLAAIDDWSDREGKEFREFTGKETGLSEIRFWVFGAFERRNHRPSRRRFRALGLYRPDQSEFILLCGYEKRSGGYVLIPPDALEYAMKQKLNYEDGKGTTRDHI